MRAHIVNEQLVCKDYQILKSLKAVAKIHNTHPGKIGKILRDNNISLPSTKEIASLFAFNKKYINETYFDVIDTEDKAYFLGLLAADGSNFLPNNLVSILLKQNDREILEKFRSALSAEITIKDYYQPTSVNKIYTWYSKLSFGNLKLSQDLLKHGICSRKSYFLKFPTTVPEHLIKHYIRGHFDGDGSFGYRWLILKSRKVPIGSIAIISTNEFIQDLISFISTSVNIKMGSKFHPNKTHCYATLGGSLQVIRFMEWLYQDSTIFLQRKHNKYLEFKDLYKKYKDTLLFNRSIVQLSLSGKYLNTFDSKESASSFLGIHPLSIYNNCSGRAKTAGGFVFCFLKNYKNI